MTLLYGNLYDTWVARTKPSATTTRMTRTTLKYLAAATGTSDWTKVEVVSEQHALALLDGAMAKCDLRSQSRSNYRNYLRRLYRFATDEGIDVDAGANNGFWPQLARGNGVPRRAQVAYERFVKWAIRRGRWPATVCPDDVLDWALDERAAPNQHWRQDYRGLQVAWEALVAEQGLRAVEFLALPAKINDGFALPISEWPRHLQDEWTRMCRAASVPLRKGGVRPWRETTRAGYEERVARFLGWFAREHPDADLTGETWATLLSADRCQDYLNWLVARSGKPYLNPSHTSFLRMARGFHRFLLGSGNDCIEALDALAKRCEVEERDQATRMAPYADLEAAFATLVSDVAKSSKPRKRTAEDGALVARRQVDAIIFGLLVTRALRSSNIRGIRIGDNLVRSDDGFELRFTAREMKGHRKFETSLPTELTTILDDYLRQGYRALTGRAPQEGDMLLVTRRGNPFGSGSFHQRVKRLSRRLVGKPIHPHFFRHIVATHAAQVWKMTPTELAAFLAHRSATTCMKYYEVTSPSLAAERVDALRESAR
jgi:integrase